MDTNWDPKGIPSPSRGTKERDRQRLRYTETREHLRELSEKVAKQEAALVELTFLCHKAIQATYDCLHTLAAIQTDLFGGSVTLPDLPKDDPEATSSEKLFPFKVFGGGNT